MTVTDLSPKRPTVLDPAQLVRIESVHGGYLYQHLYAALCLMAAGAIGAKLVLIETDEDIELIFDGRHIYIQVKHRLATLSWGDVSEAMDRFDTLRQAHAAGDRPGMPEFVIACNSAPNGPLAERIQAADWPADVRVDWPEAPVDRRGLPSPPSSLLAAVEQAQFEAARLPFAMLSPDTLVWKLAGVIMLAATGRRPGLDHTFDVATLSHVFEQLVLQLHNLPAPPVPYRVQIDEPDLVSGERIRLIAGYSGAGKTSWVAQAAQHVDGDLIYLDVGDLAGTALANSLARELARRLFGSGGQLGQVLIPGASGREILHGLSERIRQQGQTVTVVLDNAHHIPADDLLSVVQVAAAMRFVLLCRPLGDVQAIENILGVARETLLGWSADTVAADAADAGCRANAADCQRLIDLTGGLPLYAQNAIAIAVTEYGASLADFCAELATSTHSRETAQEAILGRVFDALPAATRRVADILSLCDMPLSRADAQTYLASAGVTEPEAARAFRTLRAAGVLQIYANDRLKIHDATRVIGKARLAEQGAEALRDRRAALRDIVQKSLQAAWSPQALSLFLRLTGELSDFEPLVEMATDELFHEIGLYPEIEPFLQRAAADETVAPEHRVQALDGLAFGDMRAGRQRRATQWLDQMDALIVAHELGDDERLRVGMKRMNILASDGDRAGAEALIASLSDAINAASPAHRRVLTYNVAVARLALGESAEALRMTEPLVEEYYRLLGLTPQQVMGRNANELRPLIRRGPTQLDDLKHLADTLDVYAKALDAEDLFSPFVRIHSLKFYDLVQAPESLFRVGQDLADQFIGRNDFTGALQFFDQTLLPLLHQWRLAEYLVPVRSQYAVILAYCGRFPQAEAEMARLRPYEAGLDARGQGELRDQRARIANLRRYGVPQQWEPSEGDEKGMRPLLAAMAGETRNTRPPRAPGAAKVGRNDACPCDSGKKFKKCCLP
nr:SEC-C metal-binding domain-containing protein [Brevundimonas diminuta]